MIWIIPKQYPSGTNKKKLHARSAGPFKVLQRFGSNTYVIDLPLDIGMSSTFNIEDLGAFQKPYSIPNDPFEIPPNFPPDDPIEASTCFILTLTQNDNINVILDEQVVLTRDGEVQRFLFNFVTRPDSVALESLEIHFNILIQIFKSTIRVFESYTWYDRFSPTLKELMETPNPQHKLHDFIDENDKI